MESRLARIAEESQFEIALANSGSAQPVISAIVPTYNRRELVQQAVEAIGRQHTDQPYEIIVVDNASTDGTVEALAATASDLEVPVTIVRMHRPSGPAVARNVGVLLARGRYVAFTDSDCLPTPDWLPQCLRRFSEGFDVVQGRTTAPPNQPQPFFSHFIETLDADGSFSTSNVAYLRDRVVAVGGFDPSCAYWEDVDLGWRVVRAGARHCFAPEARVYHQVLRQSTFEWLRHATNFGNWPAKAARYPEYRRHLVMRLWVDEMHALFTLALCGLLLARWRRASLALLVPYVWMFARTRGLRGRQPVLKAIAHVSRDVVAFASLIVGSVRHRSPVL